MSQKGLQRRQIMGLVDVGKITLKEAGEKMGVFYRQAKRIWTSVEIKGLDALVQGNRARRAHNRIEDGLCERVLE